MIGQVPKVCLNAITVTLILTTGAISEKLAFAPGQIWTYENPASPDSRVIVGAIDWPDVPRNPIIVSIAVTNVSMPDAGNGRLRRQTIPHLPVLAQALTRSVGALESVGELPPGFSKGYRTWKAEFDKGEAGYFTIPVAEIVEVMREAVSQLTPPE